MDPLMHLLLPMLFLLALGLDKRKVLLYAPLTILPDFDALLGMHREVLHSFIPLLVLPLALVIYSKYERPAWLSDSLIVMFYLLSHFVLDLGGVAFFWPFTSEMMYFDPEITVNLQGGLNIAFHLDYGLRPYQPMTTSDLLSQAGFGMLFLGALLAVVFRKEFASAVRSAWTVLKGFIYRYQK